jgi:hypothetical protein
LPGIPAFKDHRRRGWPECQRIGYQGFDAHDIRYIPAAKPGDYIFLFNYAEEAAMHGEVTEMVLADARDEKKLHCFRFINSVPLNQTRQDELRVNFSSSAGRL